MSAAFDHLAWEVVFAAQRMHELRLVVGTAGNVSARQGSTMLITPTRSDYRHLSADRICRIDLEEREPPPAETSREWRLHAAVYAARDDVRAIVHTHSVFATAWSFRDDPLPLKSEEAEYYAIGPVRTSPPAPAASDELAGTAARALGRSKAVLLARHGLVACALTPAAALEIAEVVEHQAHIAWLVHPVRDSAGPGCCAQGQDRPVHVALDVGRATHDVDPAATPEPGGAPRPDRERTV